MQKIVSEKKSVEKQENDIMNPDGDSSQTHSHKGRISNAAESDAVAVPLQF